MRTEILATLGPSSLNERVIERLAALGVTLFRLNLSHTRLEEARERIRFVQSVTDVPLCLDTEGAQVRTGNFVESSLKLRENSTVRVHRRPVPGDSRNLNLYPDTIVGELVAGDFLSIDALALAQVLEVTPDFATLRVLAGGTVGRNKAVTVERDLPLPPLTRKDLGILAIGRELGIRHVALSFASRAEDLEVIRGAAGPDVRVISKIESRAGLRNLAEIAERSDALLIDRGDLSRQVPLERIPATQKAIIRVAKRAQRPVYVATNLMESMVTEPHPTRAEVNDVYNTLIDGADGLVLAAETAIGDFPIECVGMVVRLAQEYEASDPEDLSLEVPDAISLLVAPHGGRLVGSQTYSTSHGGERDVAATVEVSGRTLADAALLARGTCSPLAGFMDAHTLDSVLRQYRLPGGTIWPLPFVLQVEREAVREVVPGDRLALCDPGGTARALVDVSEIFEPDRAEIARLWFGGPESSAARRLSSDGASLVAGEVTLVEPEDRTSPYELPPGQSRFILVRKGWNRVIGFHTDEPPSLSQERAQLEALKSSHADGLLITAASGPRRAHDASAELVLESYQRMLDFAVYPAGSVVLGSLPFYRRDCPAREAVFAALCHKNLGCSHFAIAAGHGLAASEADLREVRDLFEKLGDLGIEIVWVDASDRGEGQREIVSELLRSQGRAESD